MGPGTRLHHVGFVNTNANGGGRIRQSKGSIVEASEMSFSEKVGGKPEFTDIFSQTSLERGEKRLVTRVLYSFLGQWLRLLLEETSTLLQWRSKKANWTEHSTVHRSRSLHT
jgi:hypothetical protein